MNNSITKVISNSSTHIFHLKCNFKFSISLHFIADGKITRKKTETVGIAWWLHWRFEFAKSAFNKIFSISLWSRGFQTFVLHWACCLEAFWDWVLGKNFPLTSTENAGYIFCLLINTLVPALCSHPSCFYWLSCSFNLI